MQGVPLESPRSAFDLLILPIFSLCARLRILRVGAATLQTHFSSSIFQFSLFFFFRRLYLWEFVMQIDAIVVWTKRVILNALSSHTFRYAGFGTWHAVSGMIANNHRRSHTHHTNWPFASAHDSTLHLSSSPSLSLISSNSVFPL